ncbi:uncharacterized protein FOMMEDRAFT_149498 [Fomitiporia mediterranea MF3/22]|uniref:uncharacterized protein n=1 Tax=Fomitiporia mediterranea (strain MF3/22) TaxID=694068 RepID=UPI0004409719|nr:uncharacterized protein FOMMEDRAFT_149498 [Fomitiporia mediterranea MF3/22]EJC98090.1 hypothetical protein FOMMEDRAFT_149498 [Fomitiporia mediterranea MF3/22]
MENQGEAVLVRTLNSLLTSLEISLVLQTIQDLTPPLILMIFESMLRTRLPISKETRKSATYPARVEAMKIFIGVLADDVLGIDVGLGELDPRRLAEGRREEVLRVAEVLCWLGKRMSYISQDGLAVGNVARSRDTFNIAGGSGNGGNVDGPTSPSLLSAVSTNHDDSLLVHSTRSFDESHTTISTHDVLEDDSQDLQANESVNFISQHFLRPSRREREDSLLHAEHTHLHQVDDSSLAQLCPIRRPSRRYDSDSEGSSDSRTDNDSFCDCPNDVLGSSNITPPIRTTGHLETIDFEDELRLYELRRRMNPKPRISNSSPSTPRTPAGSSSGRIITRHTSPTQYTLALLDERARLWSELSRFKHDRT